MKSKKASSRVTAANREATAAAKAATQAAKWKANKFAAVDKVPARQFDKTGSMAIRAHQRASARRTQARRDSR